MVCLLGKDSIGLRGCIASIWDDGRNSAFVGRGLFDTKLMPDDDGRSKKPNL